MYSLKTPPTYRRPRWAAATLVAASLLVASVAPSTAFGTSALPKVAAHDDGRSSFHRHFYRGVPYQAARTADVVDASTMGESEMEAAVAYCSDRFRSYDPATGTYLGYDGYEHACP